MLIDKKLDFNGRNHDRVLPPEPYEMTYWKERLRSPYYRLKMAIKHLLLHKHHRVSHS